MNYNEEFKRNILIKLAENININFENQQSIERILVELLQDYTVIKNEILEEKIKVANNRISDLENSNTWLWRAIAGSLISAVVALLL